MRQRNYAEVLVVGAGPVGLFAAAELVKRGISVRVVDEEWRGTSFSYALALHGDSLELLDDLQIAGSLLEDGYRVDRIVFQEGRDSVVELDLAGAGGKYPFLAIVPQNRVETALEEWLRRRKVKVQWKHRVTGVDESADLLTAKIERWGEDQTGYAVARKTRVIERVIPFHTEFILGTDGHDSLIRRHLGFDWNPIGASDLFAVFEFLTDADLGHASRIVLDEDTTAILWPLPGGRCRWSFQLREESEFDGERIKRRLSELGHWVTTGLDEARLRALIAERAPWFQGEVRELLWSIPIRFERRLASDFGRGRMWLAGDSAHLGSPAGVQSMNVGLREVRDLAGRLEAVLRTDAPLSTLDEYGAERKSEWETLLNLSRRLRATPQASAYARKNAERILGCIPASGPRLTELLRQIGLELG